MSQISNGCFAFVDLEEHIECKMYLFITDVHSEATDCDVKSQVDSLYLVNI